MTNIVVNLTRSLLSLWQGHTVMLAHPGPGNDQAVAVTAEHPLPVVVVGGGAAPQTPDFEPDDAWEGIALFRSASPIPARLLPLDRLHVGGLALTQAPDGQPFGLNQWRLQNGALWVAVPDTVTALHWADLSVPSVVETRLMVYRAGAWVAWDGGAPGSGGGTPPAPPAIAYHYYDDANQQLVIATVAVAPTGYMFLIRDAGGLPLTAYSLGLPQLEHRLSLAPRPGETISIELLQGGNTLSSTTFTFPDASPAITGLSYDGFWLAVTLSEAMPGSTITVQQTVAGQQPAPITYPVTSSDMTQIIPIGAQPIGSSVAVTVERAGVTSAPLSLMVMPGDVLYQFGAWERTASGYTGYGPLTVTSAALVPDATVTFQCLSTEPGENLTVHFLGDGGQILSTFSLAAGATGTFTPPVGTASIQILAVGYAAITPLQIIQPAS